MQTLEQFLEDAKGAIEENKMDSDSGHEDVGYVIGNGNTEFVDDENDMSELGTYTQVFESDGEATLEIANYADNNPDEDPLKMYKITTSFSIVEVGSAVQTGADLTRAAYDKIGG